MRAASCRIQTFPAGLPGSSIRNHDVRGKPGAAAKAVGAGHAARRRWRPRTDRPQQPDGREVLETAQHVEVPLRRERETRHRRVDDLTRAVRSVQPMVRKNSRPADIAADGRQHCPARLNEQRLENHDGGVERAVPGPVRSDRQFQPPSASWSAAASARSGSTRGSGSRMTTAAGRTSRSHTPPAAGPTSRWSARRPK